MLSPPSIHQSGAYYMRLWAVPAVRTRPAFPPSSPSVRCLHYVNHCAIFTVCYFSPRYFSAGYFRAHPAGQVWCAGTLILPFGDGQGAVCLIMHATRTMSSWFNPGACVPPPRSGLRQWASTSAGPLDVRVLHVSGVVLFCTVRHRVVSCSFSRMSRPPARPGSGEKAFRDGLWEGANRAAVAPRLSLFERVAFCGGRACE